MKNLFWSVPFCLLSACGGGGGGGGGQGNTSVPLSLTLSSSTQNLEVTEGVGGTFSFTATVNGTASGTAVPVLTYDRNLFRQVSIEPGAAGKYSITLAALPAAVMGPVTGQIGVQLCEDNACTKAYPGTSRSLEYKMAVTLREWGTFQRDAAHRGFAPLHADPASFKQIWSWWLPHLGSLNSLATGDGRVFVTSDNYLQQNALYALDESTGALQWSQSVPELRLNAPAFANGMVVAHASEIRNSMVHYSLWTVRASDGSMVRRIPVNRGHPMLAPTIEGDGLFVDGADWASGVSAFSLDNGSVRWQMSDGGNAFSTPAVDKDKVVYYNGAALFVYSRADGQRVASVRDTYSDGHIASSDARSAPILGSDGNVIVLSGTQFTGFGGTSPDNKSNRRIVNFSLKAPNVGPLWVSTAGYLTQPALADGVIYAGTGAIYTGPATGYTARFDAISESTGKVLWSWTPPAPEQSFHRNVLVIRNLVFVSTDRNVYAIDLKTHQPVWQAPLPGALAIGRSGVLLIATGAELSDGRVVGIKLN